MRKLVLAAISLPSLAVAQVSLEPERGPFHAIPHFISLSTPNSMLPNPGLTDLGWKREGDQTAAPIAGSPTGGRPNFSRVAMFGSVLAPWVQLDAISTGNDRLPMPSLGGVLDPNGAQNGWIAFAFSVTPGSWRQNSPMNPPRICQGDIYSYFLPASGEVPTVLLGDVRLEQGWEHQGLAEGANVDGFDAYMPHVQSGAVGPVVYQSDAVYFSVTAWSAGQVTMRGGFPGNPTVDPGVIYQMRWSGSQWSAPTVFRTRAQLGLLSDQDVDALAVWSSPSQVNDQVVLFSIVNPPPSWQGPLMLQFSVPAVSGSGRTNVVVPPKNGLGGPIYLVDSGDIDGISVFDPETSTYNTRFGVPVQQAPLDLPELALSLSSENHPGSGKFLVSVAGLPGAAGSLDIWASVQSGSPFLIQSTILSDGSRSGATVSYFLNNPPLGSGRVDVVAFYWPVSGVPRYSWVSRILR